MASRRHDPIQRSAVAFIRGTSGSVGMTRTPIAWKTVSKLAAQHGSAHLDQVPDQRGDDRQRHRRIIPGAVQAAACAEKTQARDLRLVMRMQTVMPPGRNAAARNAETNVPVPGFSTGQRHIRRFWARRHRGSSAALCAGAREKIYRYILKNEFVQQ
ncbi:hypothetical protein [Streptomyces sp. NPDC021212]|uniref:hypothetical protein n=1 Tax=Streptomyces sp. NPDC021212 TaxID=3365118 RepID=UPI00379DBDFB